MTNAGSIPVSLLGESFIPITKTTKMEITVKYTVDMVIPKDTDIEYQADIVATTIMKHGSANYEGTSNRAARTKVLSQEASYLYQVRGKVS